MFNVLGRTAPGWILSASWKLVFLALHPLHVPSQFQMMEAFQKCPFHRWLNLIIKRTPSCSSFANWVSGEKCPFSNIAIFCLRLLGTQPSDEASSPSGGKATRPRRISRELPQTYFVCSFWSTHTYIWKYIFGCTFLHAHIYVHLWIYAKVLPPFLLYLKTSMIYWPLYTTFFPLFLVSQSSLHIFSVFFSGGFKNSKQLAIFWNILVWAVFWKFQGCEP